ncbi:MAG TPA: site-specific DNA-methyltransferase [Acidimicrobiales bacterium]|jgi:site-specific DNA-methyltransferase (adenine-specific)|nr:site-specific DNA-methyltransferase [Acidimicrobiales bacterium]
MGTSTSRFGVGRRESHDASEFYARFRPPETSADAEVVDFTPDPPLMVGDARSMAELKPACVALVVTSPPYFAGKEYEADLSTGSVPATYLDYLAMLRDVFDECKRVLEPGGRIAVNVANLGRRPYRSLSADVVRILQDDLGLLLRGEIVWVKAEGASGSCAWGSFRKATNPVLRDVSERVVVAGKGRFDRARAGESSLSTDEFMEATLDVWHLPPERARRVGHPAPFPVELPQRLIELYTYRGDLVLDPFLGSGSTAVAAVRTGRRYCGYDTDPAYVELARARVADELLSTSTSTSTPVPAKAAAGVAEDLLVAAGFTVADRDLRMPKLGLTVDLVVDGVDGTRWYVDVSGALTVTRAGLARTDQAWAAVGRAAVLRAHGHGPVLLLTSHVPRRGDPADRALRAAGLEAVGITEPATAELLRRYAAGMEPSRPA